MIFDEMPPMRAYLLQMTFLMGLYVVLIVLVERVDFATDFSQPGFLYGTALAPALPVAGMVAALVKLMERSDEFMRAVLAKRFIVASGLVYCLCTGWGFLELYAGAPDFPLFLVFPAFWGALGVVTPFIRSSR